MIFIKKKLGNLVPVEKRFFQKIKMNHVIGHDQQYKKKTFANDTKTFDNEVSAKYLMDYWNTIALYQLSTEHVQ